MKAKENQSKLSMYGTLLLFALIPMVVGMLASTVILVTNAKKEITNSVENYMYSMAVSEGEGLEEEVADDGVETALSTDALTEYCSDIILEGFPSSYCYVADATGTMLWHPTEEKIGQPVSNETIQGVCADLANGTIDDPSFVTYVFNGTNKYASYYVPADGSFVFVISADESEAMSGISSMIAKTVVVDIILLIIIILIDLGFARKITNPLKALAQSTNDLAGGNLNSEISFATNIKETRELGNAITTLQGSLQNAVGAVIKNAASLDSAVVSVDSQTSANADSSNQINRAIDEVALTSQSVAQSAQSMADKADDLGHSIDQLVENVENLKNASDEISSVNTEAASYMNTVMNSSSESVHAVQGISDKINETNEAVSQISECVQMIEDIASQTNLLSLNASIEAARAGEAGKGFAVVAEEIRKLADDSQSSASEIKEIIDKVIQISGETVDAAQQVCNTISEEQNYISETQQKFDALSDSVANSINEIRNIKSMTVELGSIKNELTGSINDLGAVSQELGSSAEEVAASCNDVANACNDTQNQTKEMRDIGSSLNEAISVFKL